MRIKDREGKWIPITDLEGTIREVKSFLAEKKKYKEKSLRRMERARRRYWRDFYLKLLLLQIAVKLIKQK